MNFKGGLMSLKYFLRRKFFTLIKLGVASFIAYHAGSSCNHYLYGSSNKPFDNQYNNDFIGKTITLNDPAHDYFSTNNQEGAFNNHDFKAEQSSIDSLVMSH